MDDNLKLLIHSNDQLKLNLAQSILEDNNINYIIKDNGIGGYMKIATGVNVYGSQIFVHKDFYDLALDLIEAYI